MVAPVQYSHSSRIVPTFKTESSDQQVKAGESASTNPDGEHNQAPAASSKAAKHSAEGGKSKA